MRAAATGTDTVQSSISFSLANTARVLGTFENLTLLNAGTASTATGNGLNNVITGNNVRQHAERRQPATTR